MAAHNRTGSIWNNVTTGAHRRKGPGTNYEMIDTLHANQSLIVLCYSRGGQVTWTSPPPHVQTNTSDAWDFVVTSDQDPGGYVADVFVDTGADITQQLGEQGTSDALRQRL